MTEESEIGTVYNVRYNPAEPEEALIDTFYQLWSFTLLMGGLGAVFMLIGFVAP